MYHGDVKITYVNRSMNKDLPKIFIFDADDYPSHDDAVVSKVMPDVKSKSSHTFEIPKKSKIYWGMASKVKEGQPINEVKLHNDKFFEHNLEGVSKSTVALNDDGKKGYQFHIED